MVIGGTNLMVIDWATSLSPLSQELIEKLLSW